MENQAHPLLPSNPEASVRASTSAPDLKVPFSSCVIEERPAPCCLVILGASGDLTQRKLMPALFTLYQNQGLPRAFHIVGCARTPMTDQAFCQRMKQAVMNAMPLDTTTWEAFENLLSYRVVDYDEKKSFLSLARELEKWDASRGTAGNRAFYLATPPDLYEPLARMLGESGLSMDSGKGRGWARIVVEKPFGRDLETAIQLDRTLHQHFQEHQIFRIDHYLAKETVQNILILRFANAIFEPLWNRRYVREVHILAAETLGVEHRAGYYERAGVLRDMFQNHMMQLLALTAMDPPATFEADRVRDEKIRVYQSLRPFPVDRLEDFLVLGQYRNGQVDGTPVPGYREEEGVALRSLTPTFASMRVFLDNWRWQGVPFTLTSGKRLARKQTQIAITFREVPHALFRQTLSEEIQTNRLVLGIYPEEKISLTFQTKNPGARLCLRTVEMDFHYRQSYSGPALDAYEKVLLDCMLGDQMLFWRQDAVEKCWAFLTPILIECETCGGREQMLHPYEAGTWGPGFPQPEAKTSSIPGP